MKQIDNMLIFLCQISADTLKRRKMSAKKLRTSLCGELSSDVVEQKLYIVNIPTIDQHCNHIVAEVCLLLVVLVSIPVYCKTLNPPTTSYQRLQPRGLLQPPGFLTSRPNVLVKLFMKLFKAI